MMKRDENENNERGDDELDNCPIANREVVRGVISLSLSLSLQYNRANTRNQLHRDIQRYESRKEIKIHRMLNDITHFSLAIFVVRVRTIFPVSSVA